MLPTWFLLTVFTVLLVLAATALFFFTLTLNVIAMQIVKRYREQYD